VVRVHVSSYPTPIEEEHPPIAPLIHLYAAAVLTLLERVTPGR
jgi:hypothetical protein